MAAKMKAASVGSNPRAGLEGRDLANLVDVSRTIVSRGVAGQRRDPPSGTWPEFGPCVCVGTDRPPDKMSVVEAPTVQFVTLDEVRQHSLRGM